MSDMYEILISGSTGGADAYEIATNRRFVESLNVDLKRQLVSASAQTQTTSASLVGNKHTANLIGELQ